LKSLTPFLQCVLDDLGTWCRTSTIRDFKTVTERLEHEGLSFLTITLADFGAELQKALDQGHVGHDQFTGFRRAGGLPRFLGGFLDQVFERGSGRLLPDPSVTCIWALRQFTLMWAKIALPCTPARVSSAIDGYLECEKDVRAADASMDPDTLGRYRRIGVLLWANVFSDVDHEVYEGEINPQHGPGATADRLRGNAKWRQSEWTRRLDQVFPVGEYLVVNPRHIEQRLADVHILEPGAERPVRVITVPKTLKTPRIIAVEPTCMQFVQQGLLASIWRALRADDLARSLIGWSSQVPNQHLACEGSRNGTLATLDLSEASDRVSNQHVRVLLANHPHLAAGVDASRSRKADVLGHVIRLAKFASMGSALCFPFESMVFATIVFVGIERALNRPITRQDIQSLAGQVRVYGDDIIVPVDYVHAVMTALSDFGLRVNVNKSFWTGKFRESCGKDYYDGTDVSIVRVRSVFPTDRTHASEIVSTVSLRNQLYQAGLWGSVRYLDNMIERLIPFPRVAETSPVLGRYSYLGADYSQKLCPRLHRPLVKGAMLRAVIPGSPLGDHAALHKCLSSPSDLPFADERHLERAGRPRTADIKTGWGPAA